MPMNKTVQMAVPFMTPLKPYAKNPPLLKMISSVAPTTGGELQFIGSAKNL